MPAADQTGIYPTFLERPSGRVFCLYFAPRAERRKNLAVLYVPPFAEEMNRSRRMAALQARAFAAKGVGTLLLDPFGTGDSGGDFGDALLSRWREDIAAAVDWLDDRNGGSVCLWGLRLGALLACAAAAEQPARFSSLLLWQPVVDGKSMLTQFLRIRVAATMADGSGAETTGSLRARLASGQPVEVAGYEISTALAEELDRLRLDDCPMSARSRIHWLEVGAEASDRVLPGGQRVVDRWREAGIKVSATTVAGDPFWAVQETTIVPELIARSADLIEGFAE